MSSNYSYIINEQSNIIGPRNQSIDKQTVERAVKHSQKIINELYSFEINIFQLLGMRNLSALIGEVFATCLIQENIDLCKKNPHQDGYPDILLMDTLGLESWNQIEYLRDKAPFSPFKTGGFEVKATCGSTPTPKICKSNGCMKPEIGDQRITMIHGYDWKAHHRETNNLFGIFWDFLDGKPTIVAVFYSNNLTEKDWGKIIKPKKDGGRTTSLSIMNRNGVKKMYTNWILMIDSAIYIDFFHKYNTKQNKRSKANC
jgi:hypothetical protein